MLRYFCEYQGVKKSLIIKYSMAKYKARLCFKVSFNNVATRDLVFRGCLRVDGCNMLKNWKEVITKGKKDDIDV